MMHFIVKSAASQRRSVNKRDRKRNARASGWTRCRDGDEEDEEAQRPCCVDCDSLSSGDVRPATSLPIYNNQTTPADLPYTN